MPKIFLTGSGNSRGYVTGSGMLNNPVRTIIRDLDNRAGTYPTLHRMNRKDTTGILPNIIFDDTRTVKFGNTIRDEFEIKEIDVFETAVDLKKWVSTPGVKVVRESDPLGDFSVTKGAVVFGGKGDSDGRWLKTKKSVTNPTLIFKVVRGPFNNDRSIVGRKTLGLDRGKPSDVLKIQISSTGTSNWVTVPIKTFYIGHGASEDFVKDSGFSPSTKFFNGLLDLNGVKSVEPLGIQNMSEANQPVISVKIGPAAFASLGFHGPFYIRFIQPSISNNTVKVWALGDVDIISREEIVTYPNLNKATFAGSFHASQSLASPNFLGSLSATGSSIAGITDFEYQKITNSQLQTHTPFNEDNIVNYENNLFYNEGTNSNVIPGFESSLLSKTKFEINLSTNQKTELGFTKIVGGNADASTFGALDNDPNNGVYDPPDDGQIFMCYWNNVSKKWDKIGQPVQRNFSKSASDHLSLAEHVSGAAVGFSPPGFIGYSPGVGSENTVVLAEPYELDNHNKPFDLFSFPFGNQYQSSESTHILAKDLGITKPFLLEKIEIDTNIMFELPKIDFESSSPNYDKVSYYHYSPYYLAEDKSNSDRPRANNLKMLVPTFFILNEKKANFSKNIVSDSGIDNLVQNNIERVSYTSQSPSRKIITSGSTERLFVDTSRDLVTYTQARIFVTSSYSDASGLAALFGPDKNLSFSVQDIIDRGLRSDLDVIRFRGGGDTSSKSVSLFQLTESLSLKSPVKIAGLRKNLSFVNLHTGPGSVSPTVFKGGDAYIISNQFNSRNHDELSSSRTIVNCLSSQRVKEGKFVFYPDTRGPSGTAAPLLKQPATDETRSELISPYLILPEDRLILGWQAPFSLIPHESWPTVKTAGRNKMTLLGDSKLILYGSQIKQNIEFHDGLNQNLTSNAVYEVIGNDPVIDQWQVEEVGELTGSIEDQFPYGTVNLPTSGLGVDQRLGFSIGSTIINKNLRLGFNFDDDYQKLYESGDDPVFRIEAVYVVGFDSIHNSNFSILGSIKDLFVKTNDLKYHVTSFGRNVPVGGLISQVQRFKIALDTTKVFDDSKLDNILSETSYGSSQNFSYWVIPNLSDPTKRITKLGGFPKYYFNRKHFGHFSDFIGQARDGKFNFVRSIELENRPKFNSVLSPAVTTQFVRSEYDNENLNFRIYKTIEPEQIDGTHANSFQSSNLSLHSTSSLPFLDNDSPRNRNYLATEVLEVIAPQI